MYSREQRQPEVSCLISLTKRSLLYVDNNSRAEDEWRAMDLLFIEASYQRSQKVVRQS